MSGHGVQRECGGGGCILCLSWLGGHDAFHVRSESKSLFVFHVKYFVRVIEHQQFEEVYAQQGEETGTHRPGSERGVLLSFESGRNCASSHHTAS